LIVDPQVDFHENGSLEVKGANEDTERLSNMIETDEALKQITQINVTLDSHQILDISHASFWVDDEGKNPAPFTLILHSDVIDGKWKTARSEFQDHAINYLQALKDNGKFQHCIWPNHCIIGSPGHAIVPRLNKALEKWCSVSRDTVNYACKGSNILTEMYSALKAEVPLDDDVNTQLNTQLIDRLLLADKILVAGQALSHCVNFTVRDLVAAFPDDRLKDIYMLEDGSSSVAGFEKAGTEFLQFCRDSGVNVCKCEDVFKSETE